MKLDLAKVARRLPGFRSSSGDAHSRRGGIAAMTDLDHEMHVVAREFQPKFYCAEYPDVCSAGIDPLQHFCAVGWREGRNPNPNFDVISYLQVNSDVAAAAINPFHHYLFHGRAEGRPVAQAVRPSVRTRLLFGLEVVDWVEQLGNLVNSAYYQSHLEQNLHPGVNPVAHFAYWGWRDGKSPSDKTDIRRLRATYAAASRLLINPCIAEIAANRGFYIFSVAAGEAPVVTSAPESVLVDGSLEGSDLLRDQAVDQESDATSSVRAEFDYGYYLHRYSDVQQAGIDAFDHYYYTGWREDRDPNADFDTQYYRETYAEELSEGVNPFFHYLMVGRTKGYRTCGQAVEQPPSASADHSIREVIRAEFSEAYYLSTYADVRKAGVDALEHFASTGWREHRNPNSAFDSAFYVSRNADIRDAGINPFWHYLVAGRAEGRLPVRPGGYRRDLIEKAHEAALKKEQYTQASGRNLSEKALLKAVQGQVASLCGDDGVVVSLSHDCYVRVVGGTQIFISDEQKLFNEYGFHYVHVSPKNGQLALAAEDDNDDFLIAVNGTFVGAASSRVMLKVLQSVLGQLKAREKYLVLHSFFGFTPAQITRIAGVLAPQRSFYWTHDYSALCEGYNLLRNDLHFCGAPPPTSMACRVCRYGKGRLAHIEHVSDLFKQLQFEVLAPSERAADIWRGGVQFKVGSVRPHPHWSLKARSAVKSAARKEKTTRHGKMPTPPIRVAFIGYPNANKGWQIYKDLVESESTSGAIQFYHLAANETPSHLGCTFVVTEVTPEERTRAIATLIEHQIDVVCMLSPWPETFSFVSHEALMAGIRVVCLANSGNVAALSAKGYRVSVFDDPHSLFSALTSTEFRSTIASDRRLQQRYDAIASGATVSIVREVPLERLPQVSL